MRRILTTISALALVASWSCNSTEKSQYCSIDADGWIYGDTLYLKPVVYDGTDTCGAVSGELDLVVRHTNSYEYSNLWLRIDYMGADTVMTDTVNVLLADTYGNWLGKGLGVSFQLQQPILRDASIDLAEDIRVSHIMRVDTLREIEQIGVVFKPNNHLSNQSNIVQ